MKIQTLSVPMTCGIQQNVDERKYTDIVSVRKNLPKFGNQCLDFRRIIGVTSRVVLQGVFLLVFNQVVAEKGSQLGPSQMQQRKGSLPSRKRQFASWKGTSAYLSDGVFCN